MLRSLAFASLLVSLPAISLAQPSATPAVPPPAAPAADPAAPPPAAPDPDTAVPVSGSDAIPAEAPTAEAPAPAAPIAAPAPAPAAAPLAPPSAAVAAPAAPLPAVYAVAPEPTKTGLAKVRASDASSHRAYLSDTALTVPKGTFSFDLLQPLLPAGMMSAHIGLTDRLQVSAAMLYIADVDATFLLRSKLRILGGDRGALSIQALLATQDDDDSGLGGGIVGSVCLDAPCKAVVSGYLNAFVNGDDLDDDDYYDDYEEEVPVHVVGGGSLIAGGDKAKLVVELNIADGGGTLYSGVRFPRQRFSFDAGMTMLAFDEGVFPIPLPFFGLTARM